MVPTCGRPRTSTEVPTPASRLICTPVIRCSASVMVDVGQLADALRRDAVLDVRSQALQLDRAYLRLAYAGDGDGRQLRSAWRRRLPRRPRSRAWPWHPALVSSVRPAAQHPALRRSPPGHPCALTAMAAAAAAASNAMDTAIDTGCLRCTFDTDVTSSLLSSESLIALRHAVGVLPISKMPLAPAPIGHRVDRQWRKCTG